MATDVPAHSTLRRPSGHLVAVLAIVGSLFVLGLVLHVRARTASHVLLLTVLVVALTWGGLPARLAAALATLTYSYFVLEPLGFVSRDPLDWLAIGTFLIAALAVGELAARAERRHLEAEQGRKEIEHLYWQLEAAFDRASEAEAARRSQQLKVALLDALTHNLRTPLTSIKAAVTALMGRGDWRDASLSPEGQADLLEVIDEETDRLNGFITGLSTLDQAGSSASLRPVRLEDIISDGLSRAEAITRDHRITVEIPPDLPPLGVDPAAVTEVLYILLDNATKYSPRGTEVRITAIRDDGHHLCVEVADDGPGIPQELRERVFEGFFRIAGREPEDPHRAGLGLGLSIARRLVESQAGRVWIETPASHKGTAVIMMLPVSVEAEARAEKPTAAVMAG